MPNLFFLSQKGLNKYKTLQKASSVLISEILSDIKLKKNFFFEDKQFIQRLGKSKGSKSLESDFDSNIIWSINEQTKPNLAAENRGNKSYDGLNFCALMFLFNVSNSK